MENKIKLYHFYFKIHQKDDRVENFHWMFINTDRVLDLINELKPMVKALVQIDEYTWEQEDNQQPRSKIAIHVDLEEPGDADGDFLGWMEHYDLTPPTINT